MYSNDKIDIIIPLKVICDLVMAVCFMSLILCKYALDMSNIFVLHTKKNI